MKKAEYKEPIIDDAERRYLSKVIRPVKNDVSAICKARSEGIEYIVVFGFFNESNCSVAPSNPEGHKLANYFRFMLSFEPGTMFKGMDEFKWYSLEELGL